MSRINYWIFIIFGGLVYGIIREIVVPNKKERKEEEAIKNIQELRQKNFNLELDKYQIISNAIEKQDILYQGSHSGKVVIFDMNEKKLHDLNFELGVKYKDLIASSPNEAQILVVIQMTKVFMFSYFGGLIKSDGSITKNIPVLRIDANVRFFDLKEDKFLGNYVIDGMSSTYYPSVAHVYELNRPISKKTLRGENNSIDFTILRDSVGEPIGITADTDEINPETIASLIIGSQIQ